jgi:Cys-tRNA(Pro) deacylase
MSDKPIMTTAIRELQDNKVPFTSHFYKYEEKGGTSVSSRELGVEEHIVIKTLIMETETKTPIIVLMHGDKQVSTKNLARIMNVKTISPCNPEVANKHSGFVVGGTSPFGTKKKMPVYIQKTILDLEKIYINGGKQGFLVSLNPQDLKRVLKPIEVEITA